MKDISDDPDVSFWEVFDEVTEELSWPHFFALAVRVPAVVDGHGHPAIGFS